MGSVNWPRVVLTGALAALLVPVGWGVARFWSLGCLLGSFFSDPNSGQWIQSEVFDAAAIADFALWFAFVWGAQGLWIQFRQSVRARGTEAHWINPLRHAAVSAILFSLQLSYYVVFGLALLSKVKGLHTETWLWATVVSLVICTFLICGLFLLAVKLWPTSRVRKWDSKPSRFTTLDLH